MYVCMYVWMDVCMYVCMDGCMYVCMYGWMDVCMYVCMDGWMDVCMYVWMDVCMYVCMYGWMDVCMYVCMYGWMDVCMYVCMYVYMTLHILCKHIHTHHFTPRYKPKNGRPKWMFYCFWTLIQKVVVLVDISQNRSWTLCPVLQPRVVCHSRTLCIDYRSWSLKKPGVANCRSPTKHGYERARTHTHTHTVFKLAIIAIFPPKTSCCENCAKIKADRSIFSILGHVLGTCR